MKVDKSCQADREAFLSLKTSRVGQSRAAGAQAAEDRTERDSEGQRAKAQNSGTVE